MTWRLLAGVFCSAVLCCSALAAEVPLDAQPKDFPAKPYRGSAHFPDFKARDRDFAEYRTRIREGIKAGPNFAGRMALITFGCGTGCNGSFVADVGNGKVSSFPLGGEDYPYLNIVYEKGSRLVSASWLKGERCLQQKLVWTGSAFSTSETKDIGDKSVCDKLSGL